MVLIYCPAQDKSQQAASVQRRGELCVCVHVHILDCCVCACVYVCKHFRANWTQHNSGDS